MNSNWFPMPSFTLGSYMAFQIKKRFNIPIIYRLLKEILETNVSILRLTPNFLEKKERFSQLSYFSRQCYLFKIFFFVFRGSNLQVSPICSLPLPTQSGGKLLVWLLFEETNIFLSFSIVICQNLYFCISKKVQQLFSPPVEQQSLSTCFVGKA